MVRVSERAREQLASIVIRRAILERVGEPQQSAQAPAEARERSPAAIKEHPVAQAYRSLFWELDVDPTKRRPAGEALARRLSAGELPSIHPLVDAYNQASAATLVALSAFDRQAVAGELTLDVPSPGETLDAIGEAEPVEPTGRHPVWRDEEGPVGLAAYRDAQRTAIGANTDEAILVALAPAEIEDAVDEALARVEQLAEPVGWRLQREIRQVRV